jgi:hypothetical protein
VYQFRHADLQDRLANQHKHPDTGRHYVDDTMTILQRCTLLRSVPAHSLFPLGRSATACSARRSFSVLRTTVVLRGAGGRIV